MTAHSRRSPPLADKLGNLAQAATAQLTKAVEGLGRVADATVRLGTAVGAVASQVGDAIDARGHATARTPAAARTTTPSPAPKRRGAAAKRSARAGTTTKSRKAKPAKPRPAASRGR